MVCVLRLKEVSITRTCIRVANIVLLVFPKLRATLGIAVQCCVCNGRKFILLSKALFS